MAKQASDPLTDGYVWAEIVCTGYCALSGGKKGMGWAFVDPAVDGAVGENFALPRTAVRSAGPGEVYKVPVSPDHSKFRMGHLTWARTFGKGSGESPDNLLFWRTKHDARAVQEREEAMHKAGKVETLAASMKGLEPLRTAYRGTDKWGRHVIEALVLQYLREGRF